MEFTFDTISEAFRGLLYCLKFSGKEVSVGRDNATASKTLELYPCNVCIKYPQYRTLLVNGRNSNPFAQLFEAIWVLSGSNELDVLEFFLPNAKQWSDNGKVWRAGYGPRIRYTVGLDDIQYERFRRSMLHENRAVSNFSVSNHAQVDQINYVVKELHNDPTSRRAVITIWEPSKECTVGTSRDFPCSNHIQFIIREGKLDCHVKMRSNCIWYGFGTVNMYEFSYMQEVIAETLGVPVGQYYHNATSLHLYENLYDSINSVIYGTQYSPRNDGINPYRACKKFVSGNEAKNIVKVIARYIKNNDWEHWEKMLYHGKSEIEDTMYYLLMYVYYKQDPVGFVKNYQKILECCPLTDMKVATHWYFNRQFKISKDLLEAVAQVKKNVISLNCDVQ